MIKDFLMTRSITSAAVVLFLHPLAATAHEISEECSAMVTNLSELSTLLIMSPDQNRIVAHKRLNNVTKLVDDMLLVSGPNVSEVIVARYSDWHGLYDNSVMLNCGVVDGCNEREFAAEFRADALNLGKACNQDSAIKTDD